MIYGELPSGDFKLFASCDQVYFKKHGIPLIYSADEHQTDLHIHVVNPSDYSFTIANIMKQETAIDLTISFEDANVNFDPRIFYSINRFLVAKDMLKNLKSMMIIDTDCLIMKRIKGDMFGGDYGLFLRDPIPNANEWETLGTHVAAGAVYIKQGCEFIQDVGFDLYSAKEKQWFMDQVALWQVHQEYEKKKDVEFFPIESTFIDWEFKKKTHIWTGKGPRKDNDPKYVEEKMQNIGFFQDWDERFWNES